MAEPQSEQDKDQQQQGEQSPRAKENAAQPNPAGEPSPGIKDKEAITSNSYGDTRDSGESAGR
jgi:hypothetical protein